MPIQTLYILVNVYTQMYSIKLIYVDTSGTVVAIQTVSLKDILYTKIFINSPKKVSNTCLIISKKHRFKTVLLFRGIL